MQTSIPEPTIEKTSREFIFFEDTNLAAALIALGCTPYEPHPVRNIESGARRFARFYFVDDEAGKTQGFVKAWCNPAEWEKFEKANPEHPLCYMRAAFIMRKRYVDAIKQSSTLVVLPGRNAEEKRLKIRGSSNGHD